VRIKSIDNQDLADLVRELQTVEPLRFLDLSENRNVSNEGLARLRGLPQLTGLNLSSCGITSSGVEFLRELPQLEYLNLSFCNKLTDQVVKILENMRRLTYVDLQGCLSITNGAI
jgi:Leucine-rich repeat (LRR) protein